MVTGGIRGGMWGLGWHQRQKGELVGGPGEQDGNGDVRFSATFVKKPHPKSLKMKMDNKKILLFQKTITGKDSNVKKNSHKRNLISLSLGRFVGSVREKNWSEKKLHNSLKNIIV